MTQDAKPIDATLRLNVISKDGSLLGTIACRVGLQTYYGPVTRFSAKSVWIRGKSGIETLFRKYDGRMPCVYQSHVPDAEVDWIN